jgi:hypothetical protein
MLTRAHAEGKLAEQISFYAKPKLLAIDELGYLPAEKHTAHLFFQLVSRLASCHCHAPRGASQGAAPSRCLLQVSSDHSRAPGNDKRFSWLLPLEPRLPPSPRRPSVARVTNVERSCGTDIKSMRALHRIAALTPACMRVRFLRVRQGGRYTAMATMPMETNRGVDPVPAAALVLLAKEAEARMSGSFLATLGTESAAALRHMHLQPLRTTRCAR